MRRSPRSRIAIPAALAAGLLATPAPAAEIEGVRFADQLEVGEQQLEVKGVGLLRYRVFIKAYVAALYLEDGEDPERVLEDVPKRLELHYFWGTDGEDFGPAADTILGRNFDKLTLSGLRERIARLSSSYRDVEAGDRYSLTYLPGRGTELAYNGEARTEVPGADFAAAYFAIWLGDDPIDASLRDQLLGRR